MKNYFFSYIDDIPKELHSELFTVQHFLSIGMIMCAWIILILIYKDKSVKAKWRLMAITSLLLPLLEVSMMIWYKSVGQFSFGYSLPLHLCSLMCIIMPITVFTKNNLLMEYSYAMGLAPSLITLFTPDVYYYPTFSFLYIQTMLVHGVICFIPIFFIFCLGFKPNIRNLPKAIAMLFCLAVMIIPVNYITNGNYFFLRYPAKGSIMEYFSSIFGSPGYLIPVFFVGCILWLLMYLPFALIEQKRKFKKPAFLTQKNINNRKFSI
ncbi:TIGR02206 family membrane protein [Ruminiclostridium herbifermentans]|uniref:TIGR02206 family membrane protein n=1 Tax=Ruminiclostridium herbifermentans TaxID=2488810 RepID=A0A4U7JGZ7_9FIRM|nr:TIGR02206 family membrane protein [Ruminiclostridium herbifermentans]QNU67757.1 TIGR02206 family membrane protein [Ruminiclostridium herbifermentans]